MNRVEYTDMVEHVKVGDTVSFVYQSSYYQCEERMNRWHDGHTIKATVLATMNGCAMILPWNNGHEMLVPTSVLKRED